jgi:hypothetical protein
MALSQPLEVGKDMTFDVFSGRSRYVIRMAVVGRDRLSTPLGDLDAMRVVPTVLYLSDGDQRKTARETTLWVSADGRRLPLRIEVTAFVGKLRADLIEVGDVTPDAKREDTPSDDSADFVTDGLPAPPQLSSRPGNRQPATR